MSFTCSTCLDALLASEEIASAPCGHIFHHSCIMKWLSTGKSNCPQCRARCSEAKLRRLFFTGGLDSTVIALDENAGSQDSVEERQEKLLLQIQSLSFKLRISDEKLSAAQVNEAAAVEKKKELRDRLRQMETDNASLREEVSAVNTQMRYLNCERGEVDKIRRDMMVIQEKLKTYKFIDEIVTSSAANVNRKLHEMGQYDETSRKWCLIVEALKRDLQSVVQEKDRLETEIRKHVSTVASCRQNCWHLEQDVLKLKQINARLLADAKCIGNLSRERSSSIDHDDSVGDDVEIMTRFDDIFSSSKCNTLKSSSNVLKDRRLGSGKRQMANEEGAPPAKCGREIKDDAGLQKSDVAISSSKDSTCLRKPLSRLADNSFTRSNVTNFNGLGSSTTPTLAEHHTVSLRFKSESKSTTSSSSARSFVKTHKPKGVGRPATSHIKSNGSSAFGQQNSIKSLVSVTARCAKQQTRLDDVIFLLDTP